MTRSSRSQSTMATLLSKPPSREERQRCWDSRDAYWTCLDKHGLWLHGLRPRDTPKEGAQPLEAPELQQSDNPNLRPNPFGPASSSSVADVPDGAPTAPQMPSKPSGQNKVSINRDLTPQEVAELSVCEQFKNTFEKECAASWVEHFNARRIGEKKQQLRQQLADKENERLRLEMEAKKK
ncbi:hypothetical protein DFJ74DRAFT_690304 [Hyaloraphidium curvatum]|nr:hypothetical protein DFJ74DRAFT_690304 [Hyaloraphidium curvatum]